MRYLFTHLNLLLLLIILLVPGCVREPASQTSLVLSNDLVNSSQVTFYGFPVKNRFVDTTFILTSKGRIYIDSEVELGAHGLFEFDWVSNHFDSIKVVNGIRKPTKDFKKEQEWTFVKKDRSNWEYALVIDDSDF